MISSSNATSKRGHAGSRLDTFLSVTLGLLLAVLALSVSAADVTYNATAYANNDITVNTIDSGKMVVMIVNTTPSVFNARSFVVSAYPLYAAADTAITSMDKVIMVGWCAKTTTELNSSLSCLNGTKFNDDPSYPYVFVQMRFPSWNGSTVASPNLVNLDGLKVVKQLAVSSFAGTYDPDKNTTSGGLGYITNISYNTAEVYAVFGVLLAVVVITLIVICVCICRRDNAMANVSKNIIDKAIDTLRSNRLKSHTGVATTGSNGSNNYAAHYNVNGEVATYGAPSIPSMPTTTVSNANQREGSNMYASPPDSHGALEREMQEMKARQTLLPDASNPQKPAP
ncbi:hypothetical protein ABB37_00952 [Leptomonas pyrrhocoris]|uniref:Uncharacterized protein n=1 Tax=Leptomonas pyrrhocoris TaxID=157538 RepID=A0A0M9GBM2_LEPPY|nr:hypothetical protein ABB37_00952 [Leptomonas pyrrhocoris]XP_015665358.1 hypothetical protein ABB37_00952 [Leptomonas pyrrhocoris]KPA86918.1 hypothetical protein ABB37_00952 [Leptomonas pyrrhocoris]KPA86919.1 hypothetical protein ABB37_00952 [Leptomonas pyrrhocoris]|eukprot:XP_015665357.1 hypothetical protein ABB37_00952 [Leptomonas pyrrhocoris]